MRINLSYIITYVTLYFRVDSRGLPMDGYLEADSKSRYFLFYKGEENEKGLVILPNEVNPSFENGYVVANAIKVMLAKAGQPSSSHLGSTTN